MTRPKTGTMNRLGLPILKGAALLALLLVILVAPVPRDAHAATPVWTDQFGTPTTDTALAITIDDLRVYVAGFTDGTLPGQSASGDVDAFVRSYDPAGAEGWTDQFGSGGTDIPRAIAVNASGVYVSGETTGALPGQTHQGGWDAFVRKYNHDGTHAWTRQFGNRDHDFAAGVAADASAIYVAGYGTFPARGFLRKYDLDGTLLWTREFDNDRGSVVGVAINSTDVYVLGQTSGAIPGHTNLGEVDGFVRKFDKDGTELWARQFGTNRNEWIQGIAADDGGAYITGYTTGRFPGQTKLGGINNANAFVRKYSADGSVAWTRQFGLEIRANAVATNPSGVYVAGQTFTALPAQVSEGSGDAFIRKYSHAGAQLWTRQFGTEQADSANAVATTAAHVYLAGETSGALPPHSNQGGRDAFVMSATADPIAFCQGLPATIVGTNGDDVIEGTAFRDVIVGLGGNDIIRGHGGHDVICGGDGDDTIFGNAGDDRIHGGHGDDVLNGGLGSDVVKGEEGHDWVAGGWGDGADIVSGGPGNDRVFGGDGSDWLWGGGGYDLLYGGEGDDVLQGNHRWDLLRGGPGNDILYGDQQNPDPANQDPAGDDLFGDEGDDQLFGQLGNDDLDGGADTDACDGGPGTNTVVNCEG